MPGNTASVEGLTIGPDHYCDSGCGVLNDQATLTLTNCAVTENTARDGGAGISYTGPTTIINSSVTSNVVLYSGSGAGIYGGSSLTITNTRISGNSGFKGPFYGGGIAANGTVTITRSIISGNSVTTRGGGIYASGNLTISDSTINNNSAGGNYLYPQSGFGGGIAAALTGTLTATVSNSTISGNFASGGGFESGIGGGIAGGLLSVNNSTLSDNSADQGGPIWNSGTLELGNTILNAGPTGENIFNNGGTINSQGYNLSSDNGGGYLTGPGDRINTNPMLGPLQDNGGPTPTHRPYPGSPAIDAGDPSFTPPPFYDQRGPGFDRVVNGRADIGSFEVQNGKPPPPSPTPTPTPTATPRPTPTPRPRPTPRPARSFYQ